MNELVTWQYVNAFAKPQIKAGRILFNQTVIEVATHENKPQSNSGLGSRFRSARFFFFTQLHPYWQVVSCQQPKCRSPSRFLLSLSATGSQHQPWQPHSGMEHKQHGLQHQMACEVLGRNTVCPIPNPSFESTLSSCKPLGANRIAKP